MVYSSILHTPLGYIRAITNDKAVFKLDWQQTPFILHPDAPAARQNDVSRETIHAFPEPRITGWESLANRCILPGCLGNSARSFGSVVAVAAS